MKAAGRLKKLRALILAMVVLLAPVARVWAEEKPELPEGSTEAAPPDEVKAEDVKEQATPSKDEVPHIPGKPKADLKEEHFLWGNFFLGAFGGGVLGGALGILFSNGEQEQMKRGGAIGLGSGLVVGGLGAFLLGATTPVPPVPPKVESRLGALALGLNPQGMNIAWSLDF